MTLAIYLCSYVFRKVLDNKKTQNIIKQSNLEEINKKEDRVEDIKYQKNNNLVENSELIIENLNFKSKTQDNKEYNIKAQKAEKKLEGEYELDGVNANIENDAGTINLNSNSGFFNEDSGYLLLKGDIKGEYLGYNLFGNLFQISTKDQTLISPEKVMIVGEKGKIISDKLKIKKDEIIEFEGNVKTYFNPD